VKLAGINKIAGHRPISTQKLSVKHGHQKKFNVTVT